MIRGRYEARSRSLALGEVGEATQERHAEGVALLRMELRRPHVAPLDRRSDRCPVVHGRRDIAGILAIEVRTSA